MYNGYIRNKAMVVKHEIKSQLAKLLATEDLIVEHKNVETAQFDVGTRVLTLPLWDRASGTVYDMLVGHEVGHALFTPDRDWFKEVQMPQQFVNIVEDVRIEKLMKRKYAGLAKCFYHGYEELNDDDFFRINDEDLNTFNLADRINLYYKIGNFVDISFSTTEKQIVSLVDSCETFDQVLDAAKALYDFCVAETQKDENGSEKEQEGTGNDEITMENIPCDGDPEEGSSEKSEEKGTRKEDPADLDTPSYEGDDLDLKTVDALEDALKDLTNTNQYHETRYFEIPKIRLDRVIVPNKEIHEHCKLYWDGELKEWEERAVEYGFDLSMSRFEETDNEFAKFKKSAQKEVNYLVKEFECRKSASSYARATTNRTGILDTAKLHTYRYNEDLFKKISVIPDGKNHGLLFILDWSGSMGHIMLDTIKQLYNLLWFCKKVNIPFDVYAFTNNYPRQSYLDDGEPTSARMPCYEKREGVAYIEESFSLMNLFTSKVRSKVLEEQMRNIFRIGLSFENTYGSPYGIPIGMNLSGTPLNEALVCLHQILPQFKTENKIEKVQCVILTDGEGSPLRYHKNFQRNWEHEPYLGTANTSENTFLRDRKTGHTYNMGCGWWEQTDIFLRNLRDKFTDVNFIGIRVLAKRDANGFIRRYTGSYGDQNEILTKSWRKNKSFSIKNSGYHTYFGIGSSILDNDSEFEVDDDATKAQIRSAFKKSLTSKKMNKKILNEFIELVA